MRRTARRIDASEPARSAAFVDAHATPTPGRTLRGAGRAARHSGNRSRNEQLSSVGSDRGLHRSKRSSARPARAFSSFASSVPSLSGLAALKRCSTTDRYSSSVSVPSRSGSAAARLFRRQPSAQFARIERAVVIGIELCEQGGGGLLHFGQIERAVIVGIEQFDRIAGGGPCRSGHQCNGERERD